MPNTSDDSELLWSSSVDDNTGEFFEKFNKNVDATQAKAEEGFANVDKSVKGTGMELGILIGIFSSLTTSVVNFAMKSLVQLAAFAGQSKDLRARVDTLAVSLYQVAENAGYTKEQIDALEKSIKDKGITTSKAKDSLIQMAQAELDLTKSADLARVAQDAAVNAGKNSSETYDRITQAIITLQPEILRNLNLNVNAAAAYQKYALSINKTADSLTLTEKRQALTNATLQAGSIIAGTYEKSLGSVGKLLTSLPRYIEEIQYQLGGMFQEGYLALVETYKDLLSDILKFLKENEGALEDIGRVSGDVIRGLVLLFKDLLSTIGDITDFFTGALNGAIIEIGKVFGLTNDQVDIFKNNVFDTFVKAIALAKATAKGIEAVYDALTGSDVQEANAKALEKYGDIINKSQYPALTQAAYAQEFMNERVDIGTAYQNAYNESIKESLEWIYRDISAKEDAADMTNYLANQEAKLADAVAQTSAKFQQLYEKTVEDYANRAIAVQRQQIEEQLRLQWQNEDRERSHQERISQILEGAEESKQQLAKTAAENRVKVEEDYRKRLQAIQEDFNFEASELARKRDAVGLLALVRQNKRQLDKEQGAYKERKEAAEKSYNETIKQIDESLQKQLQKAEQARVKELEGYQRNLDRQKVLKEMHNQWEAEDRQRAQDRALNDVIKFYNSLDGATQAGLDQLLTDWSWYFTSLGGVIDTYNAIAEGGATTAGGSSIKRLEKKYNQDLDGDGKIGQAGMVSQMLAPTHLDASAIGNVSQVPAVSGSSRGGTQTKVIRFEGNVSGMDPYIQRVMVQALLEIERNSG